MSLVIALKNRTSLVVASDSDGAQPAGSFGQLMPISKRAVLLTAGNTAAVEASIKKILPRLTPDTPAASLAQYLQAAMVLDVVPKLANLKGRVEFVVAGFDPIRHIEEPTIYYLDSARSFKLELVHADAVAAGATAAVTSLVAGHSFADATIDQLKVLAKECLSATKLRWPGAVKNHIQIGVITTGAIHVQEY